MAKKSNKIQKNEIMKFFNETICYIFNTTGIDLYDLVYLNSLIIDC